jgi:hypothetical protein
MSRGPFSHVVVRTLATMAFLLAALAMPRRAGAAPADDPMGDFAHSPPEAAQANTPLPLYFEYPGDQPVVRVTLKYWGTHGQDWQRLELQRVAKGWGGTIPCADVTPGVMRYWLVGFDANGGALITGGGARHPYVVPVRAGSVSSPPHLPGRAPPHRCSPGDTGEGSDSTAGESTDSSAPPSEGSSSGSVDDKDASREKKKDKDDKETTPEDTARKHAALEIASYTDSDHVTVFTPSVTFGVDNTSGASLSGSYLVDVVSAASVDIVSTASQRWQEVRQAGDLSGQYKPHDLGVGVGGSVSREPDYLSLGAFGTVTKDFDEKNWTLTGGYGYSHDTAGRCGADGVCTPFSVFARQLDRSSFNGGITWVVDSATIGSVSLDLVLEGGDQSKPYRYIPMFSPNVAATIPKGAPIGLVNAYRLPERPLEQLPLELRRTAVTGHYAHRLDGSTLRLEERIYNDDWGLVASTSDARWILDLGRRIELWPHVRFHAQSSTVFWKRAYVSASPNGWDLPQYRTGDRELGPLVTFGTGLGARMYLGSKGRPDQFALQIAWDGMFTSYLDDLYITQRTAMLGTLTFLGEL